MMDKLRTLLQAINDPASREGTVWWASAVCGVWSAFHQGITWQNGLFLLSLAGIKAVASMVPGSQPQA